MPFLSVIVPVHNVKNYLTRCVKSIQNQSYTDFEIILVDDGSSDGSSELCDELKSNDSRIKVIHKRNEGVAIARTTGLHDASGTYVHFVDSDDWIEPDTYKECFSSLENPDVILFGFNRIDENNKILYKNLPEQSSDITKLLSEKYDDSFLIWNKLIKKEILNTIDFSAINGVTFSEDSYVSVCALCTSKTIKIISDSFYNYFYRSESVTRKMSVKNHNDELKSTILIENQLKKYNFNTDTPLINQKKFNCKKYLIEFDKSLSLKYFFKNLIKFNKIFPKIENKVDISKKSKYEQLIIKSTSKKLYLVSLIFFIIKRFFN